MLWKERDKHDAGKGLILFLLWCVCLSGLGQKEEVIDQIFAEWDQNQHPGGVVLVSKGSDILYSKAFGLANIQYNVPITLASTFNLGSVSKQFTALGIAKLEEEGKLSFKDEIHQYIPELPDFGFKITLAHLLNHTSGLRSTPELFALAGWREGEPITTEDDLNYLCKQQSLNFKPGSEYMYSNSNYVLLAVIISRVTHQDFSTWMRSNIFEPLKMRNTYVDEFNLQISAETSTPYVEQEERLFVIAQNSSLDLGATNVYSTATDLTLWLKKMYDPDAEWKKLIDQLKSRDTLLSGEINNYNFGLITDNYHGNKRIYHTGGVPGYLSFAMCFPEEQLSVVVLTNYIDYKAHEKVDHLLSLFLKNKKEKAKKQKKPTEAALNTAAAINYCSDYWNVNSHYARKVFLEDDTLWYLRTNGYKSPLLQVKDSVFIIGGIMATVYVEFKKKGGELYMYVKDGDKPVEVFEPFSASPPSAADLAEYSGVYYSPELETSYKIIFENEKLMGYHSRHGYFDIEILRKDIMDWSGLAVVHYERDDFGSIVGFYVTLNRVRNVWFEKER